MVEDARVEAGGGRRPDAVSATCSQHVCSIQEPLLLVLSRDHSSIPTVYTSAGTRTG